MFHSTCGMGDIFSMLTGGAGGSLTVGAPPPPPPPPPVVVQVSTPNVVQTDGGMPGGDISQQYMPGGAPAIQLNLGPNAAALVACIQKKGTWDPKTATCRAPVLALRLGTLFATQTTPMPVPPKTKILLFGQGGGTTTTSLPSSGVPQIGFELRNNLWIVSAAALPVLQAALSGMGYASADPSGMTGQASFILPSSSEAIMTANFVVNNHIAQGHAALIEKASVGTGSFNFVFTGDPSVVAKLAGGAAATHALVTDKPDSVVAGALAQVNAGTVPAAAVASTTPWLAIGVVAAGIAIAGALYMTRKPAHATANASKRGVTRKRHYTKEEWAARKARAARRARRAAREDYL